MKAYKLVDQQMRTRAGEFNEIIWRAGVKHTATGANNRLCTDGVIHSCATPELAAFLNPIHANIKNPRCIELKCSKIVAADQLKQGHKSAAMVCEFPMIAPTKRQCVIFVILCVRAILNRALIPAWEVWADLYLAGDAAADAGSAMRAVCTMAYAAAHAAAGVADATDAAYAAAHAAASAADVSAAHAAAGVADASRAAQNIDFAKAAQQAMAY